ncbi:MAG TPA: hypothetical protein VN281_14935, partial [Verrucomicrobiae bacterium]|nr:hypothetical protein [Verrucomicrobiae bacterium]
QQLIMITDKRSRTEAPLDGLKSHLTFKKLAIRFLVIWFLIGQMVLVCLPASTTRPLSRLESVYAFQPSSANKAALDNEFNRVATFESHRAIGRFAVLLLVDVAIVAFFWNAGGRRKRSLNPSPVPTAVLAPRPG